MKNGRKPSDYSNIIGKTFGQLTILSYTEPVKENRYRRMCHCRCACGDAIKLKEEKLAESERYVQELLEAKERNGKR